MLHNQLPKAVMTFVVALAFSVSAGLADAPDRKNKVSGEEVWKLYAGKTWIWSKGGSFWAGDGSFEAAWDGSVGVGKWYATSAGNLCYEAQWKREAGGDAADVKRCWKHVRDSKGRMWKQDPQTKDWYRSEKELAERVKSGNKIKAEVRKLRKKTGL